MVCEKKLGTNYSNVQWSGLQEKAVGVGEAKFLVMRWERNFHPCLFSLSVFAYYAPPCVHFSIYITETYA